MACSNDTCTEGLAACPECNGWGVLNPKGKRYRKGCKAIPAWALPHETCGGTGLVVCGCVTLTQVDLDVLGVSA